MAVEQTRPKPAVRRPFGKRKQLEQDLEHVTQQMYVKNLELVDTNKTLSLLRNIDSLVLESQEPLEATATKITQAITSIAEYPFVALMIERLHHPNELQLYGLSVKDSLPSNSLDLSTVKVDVDDFKWFEATDKTHVIHLHGLGHDEIRKSLHTKAEVVETMLDKLKVKAVFSIKLMARGKLVGIMAVGLNDELHENDSKLLERLAEAVGVAVDNKLLYEENQHVLGQLQKSNVKLKALDETKDEFISMASHQLRTPLTSMKGYVSMVLEGDAGKISAMQRKLLDQAFVSSQRMVYLIADLLNVSRLRTGKFIIETKPTDLSQVVEEEIGQLIETAKGRGLELTYTKPKNFPLLMLDETKIRQVIMNFADNAIYYTPTGGHIKVGLADKGKTIEFTVVDDGLGVPKAEQHHLFSKFYRAQNAQKARPDGTGLGLFMAKKVIVAQGGAIIFQSQENKGSTFGFSFSKEKLKPSAEDLKGAEASGGSKLSGPSLETPAVAKTMPAEPKSEQEKSKPGGKK